MADRRRGQRRQPQANKPEVILHRGMIIGRYLSNISVNKISREMGISRNSVKRWIQRYEAEGHVNTRPRSGRPRITTQQQDADLLTAARQAHFKTSLTLARYSIILSFHYTILK